MILIGLALATLLLTSACGSGNTEIGNPTLSGNQDPKEGPNDAKPEPLKLLSVKTPVVISRSVVIQFNDLVIQESLENGIVFTDQVTHQEIPYTVEPYQAQENSWYLSPDNQEQKWPLGHEVIAVIQDGTDGPQGVRGNIPFKQIYVFSFTAKLESPVIPILDPATY